jgi:hypothetical protein
MSDSKTLDNMRREPALAAKPGTAFLYRVPGQPPKQSNQDIAVDRKAPPQAMERPSVLSAGVMNEPNLQHIRQYADKCLNLYNRTRVSFLNRAHSALNDFLRKGGDGLVFSNGEDIVGHVFFTKNGSALNLYATGITEKYFGQNLNLAAMRAFIQHAKKLSEITQIVLYNEASPEKVPLKRMLIKLSSEQQALGVEINTSNGTINLPPKKP